MSKRKQTWNNYKEKVVKKRRNNKLFDFPEYDHPHVHTTAEPAPPPLNNGPSLIPIFPQTFSFSLVYSLLRAGINQSVSDTEVQEFLEQESGESQPEDNESDKSPKLVNPNGQGTCNIRISVIQRMNHNAEMMITIACSKFTKLCTWF